MKATTKNQFNTKFRTEVKKESQSKDALTVRENSNHRDMIVNKIQDDLKWAYDQKS